MAIARLHIEASLERLPALYAFCAEQGVGDRCLLALEEAFVNIVSYSGATAIDLACEDSAAALVFTLEDDGRPFDPVSFSPREGGDGRLVAGGQGIRIMRTMMDGVLYQRAGGRNVLSLIKYK